MEGSLTERLHFGKMGYGCKHYRRRCMIRAPCCNEIYSCRHCHNEATSMLRNHSEHHELVRQAVEQVVCSVCDTEQPVAQVCTNCGVKMGEYFCNICKFFDDDTEKQQFHCDDCGICRVGGRENFFHCKKCGYCVENSMRHHCPICFESKEDPSGCAFMKWTADPWPPQTQSQSIETQRVETGCAHCVELRNTIREMKNDGESTKNLLKIALYSIFLLVVACVMLILKSGHSV